METIENIKSDKGLITIIRKFEDRIVNWNNGNIERILTGEIWYLNGKYHREGDAALKYWGIHTLDNKIESFLTSESWYLNGQLHREGDAAFRSWKIHNDGNEIERFLTYESWYHRGKLHTYSLIPDNIGTYWKSDKYYIKEILFAKAKCILRFMRRVVIKGKIRRKAISKNIEKVRGKVFPGLFSII